MLPEVLHPYPDAEAAGKILADTRRWLERAVIGLNLCPFAKSVHVKKQIRYALSAAATPDELLAELEREFTLLSETDPALLDTTQRNVDEAVALVLDLVGQGAKSSG